MIVVPIGDSSILFNWLLDFIYIKMDLWYIAIINTFCGDHISIVCFCSVINVSVLGWHGGIVILFSTIVFHDVVVVVFVTLRISIMTNLKVCQANPWIAFKILSPREYFLGHKENTVSV